MLSRSNTTSFVNAYHLCLLVMVAGDFLLFDEPLGMALGLFAAIIHGVLALYHPAMFQQKPARGLWLGGLGLILTLFLDPGPLACMLLSICWIAVVFCVRQGGTLDMRQWQRRYAGFLLFAWLRLFRDGNRLRKWKQRQLKRQGNPGTHKFPQWLIPLGLGAIFLFLFYHANPIYAQVLDRLSARFPLLSLDLARWLFWVGLACWTWALLKYRTRRAVKTTAAGKVPRSWLDPQTTSQSLVLFNLIFALHTALDITYLWAGYQLPPGVTYASFAHRGAYLLVATAILAGLFILSMEPDQVTTGTGNGVPARTRLIRGLLITWVAQNILLTFSAIQRLKLYVSVYGLTHLRLSAAIWIGLVAVGLLLILWRYLKRESKNWLVIANLISLTAVLYGCCFLNFEGTIARYNLQRVMTNPQHKLDKHYLVDLGPKALPPLLAIADSDPGLYQRLNGDKTVEKILFKARHHQENWRGWSWRYHQAFSLAEKAQANPPPRP